MADIQSQLPIKITDNTNTVSIVGTALKVDGSAVTQPVSGTVTANAGTGSFTVIGAGTAGTANSGVVTVQGIASMTAIKVDGSAVTQPVSIGSTVNIAGTGTAGTANAGVVTVQGIASMTALKVDGSATTQPVSGTVAVSSVGGTVSVTQGETSAGIVAYASSSSAVANAAVGTITYTVTVAKTFYLKQIHASASGGPCKVVVDYGAGPTVIATGFTSAADPNFDITFAQPISIAASTAVNVKITNSAGSAQDVYASIFGHEV